MRAFRRRGDRLVAELDPSEAALLHQVVGEVRDLLAADDASSVGSGTGPDPVIARLLPDGHRSDADLAADYRSLTEEGLRAEKLADAALVLDTVPVEGGRVTLDEDAAHAWLRTLNDVRLGIGVLLDVQDSDDPVLRAEESGDPRWVSYSWLTAVQGLLVDAIAG